MTCTGVKTFLEIERDPTEQARYRNALESFSGLRRYIQERSVLDFGASNGLSICALLQTGASRVIGVEPDPKRVLRGQRILGELGLLEKATILPIGYAPKLDFQDTCFDTVIANAVLEHIPTNRALYVRELWRVLRRGGHLIISETPNKYLPLDRHTTGLWWVPWLPSSLSRRYAIWRGKFDHHKDWTTSGWCGVGYREIVAGLANYKLIPERSRFRHVLLTKIGLPASLFDPYPVWIFEKEDSDERKCHHQRP